MKKLDELFSLCKTGGVCAVAQGDDEDVLKACIMARQRKIASFILCGDETGIKQKLLDLDEDPMSWEIHHCTSPQESARKAVMLVKENQAKALMKGLVNTSVFMKEVLGSLRGPGLLSHVMVYEVPSYPKLLFNTDGGLIPFPDASQKTQILENAIGLLHKLGYASINAALIAGSEVVSSKIQSTVDAQFISSQKKRWLDSGCNVYGPVGLDLAISREACEHKAYNEAGSAQADILLVPTYEVGNAMGKAMSYFAGAKNAGVVLGAQCPIVLTSRSDSPMTKLYSLALAMI